MRLILKALNLKNDQTIIDLGAGDGIVIFEAAKLAHSKKLSTKFIAVELNPVLVLIMYFRRFFHPNKNNIQIVQDDIFSTNLKRLTLNASPLTFYLYISPWYMQKVLDNLKKQLKKFSVVSYFYPLPKNTLSLRESFTGIHKVFVY